ncbi:MAG TPA: glutathione peroxidase [Mycobacteriales bacterium]|nr:glutathione peroxidase [Mycobacteriales bacterium]
MSVHDIPLRTLHGEPTTLAEHAGKVIMLVNVASKCGQTKQYTAIEELHERFAPKGFTVLGFPCNQFGGQEPGSPEEIEQFCSTTYGVSFPLYEKLDVNGDDRHPLYDELTKVADDDGVAGDVHWNFEKFLVSPEGEVIRRFRPLTTVDDPRVVDAVTAALPEPAP